MERKGSMRGGRVVNLRAVASGKVRGDDSKQNSGPPQEVIGIALGYRMVYSDQAEVWTLVGQTRDGQGTLESVGELSFVLIPGSAEPATAIIGFIAPPAPYVLGMTEETMWPQLRGIIVQLGYDLDGFYASVSLGGRNTYYEEYGDEK